MPFLGPSHAIFRPFPCHFETLPIPYKGSFRALSAAISVSLWSPFRFPLDHSFWPDVHSLYIINVFKLCMVFIVLSPRMTNRWLNPCFVCFCFVFFPQFYFCFASMINTIWMSISEWLLLEHGSGITKSHIPNKCYSCQVFMIL